jgi:hypothetical protein
MSIGTAFLDHLAKYGFAIGAVLFVLGKPVLGAARGFRAGLRTDSTNQN